MIDRAKPRYAANLEVEIFTRGLNHEKVARIANISSGGLFVCTDYKSEIGEKVHLRITFSDRDAFFDVKGRVVWVCQGEKGHPNGLGLEFDEVSAPQQEIINKILSQYINVRDS
jgi:uncharacterized protein (TIGR02266 family)